MGRDDYNTETLELAVSTSGYTNIVFKYKRLSGGYWEPQDYIMAEWYDGSNWHELERKYGNFSSWNSETWYLGAGANDNAVINVPFVLITARRPRSVAYDTSSKRSSRINGSPPLNNKTGAPNAVN